jgi:hypothetical protein
MTSLTGDQLQVAGGERMSVFGGSLILASVMAVFTGMHAVVQIISYGLLAGISFRKIVILITWVTGNAVEAFRFMDIFFYIPLAAYPSSVGCGVARPTVLVGGLPDDLKLKIFKIRHLFFSIIYYHLVHS